MRKWLSLHWKRIIGGALVVAPFAGMFAIDVAENGIMSAAVTFCGAFAIVAVLAIGIWLLTNGGKSC